MNHSRGINWKWCLAAIIGAGVGGWIGPWNVPPTRAADAAKVDFNKDIKPILAASCIKCHHVEANNPKVKPKAGLRLDDKAAALKGGENGHDIVPGSAKDSLLYQLLLGPVKKGDDEIAAMPRPADKKDQWKSLPQDQIDLIKRWIDQGADWP
jgi:mono/diheme cytochrome c family protein